MQYKIGILQGDGIGPEIVGSALAVLKAALKNYPDIAIQLEEYPFGWDGYQKFKNTFPQQTNEGLRTCQAAIVGPASTGTYPFDNLAQGSPGGLLRKEFDLYANIRVIKSYDRIETPLKNSKNIHIVVMRQNTEGFYPDRALFEGYGEFMPKEGLVISLRVISEKECRRIARYAFDLAKAQGFPKVTAVHKANAIRWGDGLFLKSCQDIAKEYPGIPLEDFFIDNFAMQLIRRPQYFGVVVTTNLFGDILSDEAAGLVGGLGLAPSINVGDEFGIAQVTGGSAPDIAGKNIANPCAMILSVKMLIDWLGAKYGDPRLKEMGWNMGQAVEKVLNEGTVLTPDVNGTATTEEVTAAICKSL